MQERLQKFMARCGIASRRKCEEIISEGRVEINGKIVTTSVPVNEQKDIVTVDGKPIKPQERMIYIIMNKPPQVITSSEDQFDRETVLDLVKIRERIYPVGRLDYDTTGAILLTNDGDLANKLTHPSKGVEKVYVAKVKGIPSEKDIQIFKEGFRIGRHKTAPAELKIVRVREGNAEIQIKIHEGKYHQIKLMCEHIGHEVKKLKRTRIANLTIEGLQQGEWRHLTPEELKYLKMI